MTSAERTTVAAVIPCFEQAGSLPAAIESVLVQTRSADEIIVVDDGGADDLEAVVSVYPSVRLLRQDNRGLAAARNAGLREATSEKILFLDADDEILPDAVACGLRCFGAHSDAAFVYGGFEEDGPRGRTIRAARPMDRTDLLRCNWVAMIATVLFDRAKLLEAGGFDETLRMCEDWDAYLRLSREHPFAAYDRIVAIYRKHEASMSADPGALRGWIDEVRSRERARGLTAVELRAWREGERVWDLYYGRAHRWPLKRAARKVSRALLGN